MGKVQVDKAKLDALKDRLAEYEADLEALAEYNRQLVNYIDHTGLTPKQGETTESYQARMKKVVLKLVPKITTALMGGSLDKIADSLPINKVLKTFTKIHEIVNKYGEDETQTIIQRLSSSGDEYGTNENEPGNDSGATRESAIHGTGNQPATADRTTARG